MTRSRTALVVAIVLAVSSALAAVELVLTDGQVLPGVDVRREGNVYLLETESGAVLTFPVELVDQVRLAMKSRKPTKATDPPPGYRNEGPENLGGQVLDEENRGPTGMREGQPQTLAGQPVRPARPSEQTAVLGKPAEFQQDVVRMDWVPETDWNMDPHEQNNFAPSTWSKSIVDTDWQPKSAFDPKEDVMADSKSSWQKGLSNPTWTPEDGFKKSVW
jgi:hypothetical protein